MVRIDLEGGFWGADVSRDNEGGCEEREGVGGGFIKRTQTRAKTITAETPGTDATLTLQLGEKSDFRFNYPPCGRK